MFVERLEPNLIITIVKGFGPDQVLVSLSQRIAAGDAQREQCNYAAPERQECIMCRMTLHNDQTTSPMRRSLLTAGIPFILQPFLSLRETRLRFSRSRHVCIKYACKHTMTLGQVA